MENGIDEVSMLYRTISLNSRLGIAIIQEGKLVFANPYLRECFGYANEELIGKTIIEFIHPEDREAARQNALQMLRGQTEMPYTYRILSGDGKIRWIVETVASIVYRGKRAVLGNIMDVTERKELEQQLADAREMLIRTEKLSAIGTLAGGISHEILNPLNIISMTIQMMELQEWPPEKTKEMLAVCQRQVSRIERIARDISAFARTSKNEFSPVSLNGMIESVLNLITPKLRLAHVSLEKQFQPDMPDVLLDQNNMWQVIMNMVGNSIDAMAGKEEKRLVVTTSFETSPEGDCERVVFADTGTGIEEEQMKRIFDPFFTTKEPGKGTGLGLSISFGIVQEHGGRLWARNNEWGGASFIVELPVKRIE